MKQPRKTPTKEQKAWMDSAGYTSMQLDNFWRDVAETNPVVRNLNNNGMSWRDMNLSCVMQLPTQKERDLKAIAEKEAKEKAEKAAKVKEQKEREYYWEHFDEIMVSKIENKTPLSKDELQELVFGFDVETERGDHGRWTENCRTIVKLKGRFFSICWERGLTEYQENEFYSQPVEVKKRTFEKTITVTEWVSIVEQ